MYTNTEKTSHPKSGIFRICFSVIMLSCVGFASCNERAELIRIVELPQYPSGSSLERQEDNVYLIGDDATKAILLNRQLQVTDSIKLFADTIQRIPKSYKADIECGGIFADSTLLWLGSGSAPQRRTGIRYHLNTRDTQHISLETFYNRLLGAGIPSLNLEGMAVTPQQVILANRAHGKKPVNQLIFTTHAFWKKQDRASIRVVKAGFLPPGSATQGIQGLSGLAYSSRYDRLFATVSTETGAGGVADGSIGESYLWVFDDISPKRAFTALNPTKIIPLSDMDPRLKNQKVESVAVLEENEKYVWLALTVDNDDGKTILFEVKIPNAPPERKGSNFWDL